MKKRFITVDFEHGDILKGIVEIATSESPVNACYDSIRKSLDSNGIPFHDEEQTDATVLACKEGYISVYYEASTTSWNYVAH